VRLQGWVHRLRTQKTNYFIVLRDGSGFVQCILSGDCIRTLDALDLTVESSVEVYGTVEKVKEGQTAPGGVEVMVDYWKIIGRAPGGDEAFEGRLRPVGFSLFAITPHLTYPGHRGIYSCRLAPSRAQRRDSYGCDACPRHPSSCFQRALPRPPNHRGHSPLYGSDLRRRWIDLVRVQLLWCSGVPHSKLSAVP
jgi:hypothetical protein